MNEPQPTNTEPAPAKHATGQTLVRGTLVLSLSTAILNALAFLATLLTLRTLAADQYGHVVLWLSIYATAIAFLDFGISSIIISEVARGRSQDRPDVAKRFLLRYGQMQAVLSSAAILITFITGWGAAQIDPGVALETYFILGFFIALTGLKNFAFVLLVSHARYVESAKLEASIGLARLVFVIAFVVVLRWAERGVMLTYPLAMLLGLILIIPASRSIWKPLHSIKPANEPVFRIALREQGIYTAISSPIKSIRDQAPVWSLQFALGSQAVGLYGTAMSVISLIFALLQSLETVLVPALAARIDTSAEAVNNTVIKAIKYGVWIATPMVILIWFFAPLAFSVAFQGRYDEAVPLFRALLILVILFPLVLAQRPLLLVLRAQKFILAANFAGAAVLFTSVIWIAVFGLQGIVLALLIATLAEIGVRQLSLARLSHGIRIQWRRILEFDNEDRMLVKRLAAHVKIRR